ncbi:MAG: type II toxin-antitoxin system HicB family antitoxin [Anaerotignum sp.]|nr:type II toxin-antitoxin system HicB family antitoxin [Anaerotignum sp.]
MKLFYPALFHKTDEGGFWISFPDIPECLTEGDNMSNAYEMAVDALGLCMEDRIAEGNVPSPSDPSSIFIDDDAFLVVVEFDQLEYRKKHSKKAVKKTLTIPEWLNEEAIARNINFSQTLQEALIAKCQP